MNIHKTQVDLINRLIANEVAVEEEPADEDTEDVGDGTKVEREELSAE